MIRYCLLATMWYLSYFVSVWIHEAGHAIFGCIAGYRITAFGTGFGRLLFRWKLGSVVLFSRSGGGGIAYCYSPQIYMPRRSQVLLYAGGIIANAITLLLLLPIASINHTARVWLTPLLFFSLSAVIRNGFARPVRIKGVKYLTDGLHLRNTLHRKHSASMDWDLASLRSFTESLRELQNHEYLFYQLIYSSIPQRLTLLDPVGAHDALTEAGSIPLFDQDWQAISLAYADVMISLRTDPSGAKAKAIRAQQLAGDKHYGMLRDLVAVLNINACIENGEYLAAKELLSHLRILGAFGEEPAMQAYLAYLETECLLGSQDTSNAVLKITLMRSLKEEIGSEPEPAMHLRLGDLLVKNGMCNEASVEYVSACIDIRRLYVSQSATNDREHFSAQCLSDLARIAQWFRDSGDVKNAAMADSLFSDAEAELEIKHQKIIARYRRFYRDIQSSSHATQSGLFANALITFVMWQSTSFEHHDFASILCLGSYICTIFGVILLYIQRRSFGVAQYGGVTGIVLSLVPWIVAFACTH